MYQSNFSSFIFDEKITLKLGIYTVAILIHLSVDLNGQKLLTHIFSDNRSTQTLI